MPDLVRTTLAIEKELLGKFDAWMAEHGYGNRSEAVRDLMRSALVEQQWAKPDAEVVAALCIIYDHNRPDLAQNLTKLQHADHHAILCSQHVHLDHDQCMETIVMKGTADQLRRVSDAICSTRGVKLGKLTLLSGDI